MDAPIPLVPVNKINPEEGGSGTLVDRYSDHDDGSSTRYMVVRFQDDRSGRWSKDKLISIGKEGEGVVPRDLCPMGTYKTRQYEFVFDANCKFGLYDVEEIIRGLK